MKRLRRLAGGALVCAALAAGKANAGDPFLRIPEADRAVLARVAAEYQLDGESKRLLFAIRIVENGPAGKELGVLAPDAMRYAGSHAQSLELQARWAAGTIKRRYQGNLETFAQRWAPTANAANDPRGLNKNWLPNIRAVLAQKGR